jgi:hypothetical protein
LLADLEGHAPERDIVRVKDPWWALKMTHGLPDISAYRRRFANIGEAYRSFAFAGPGCFVATQPRMIASTCHS